MEAMPAPGLPRAATTALPIAAGHRRADTAPPPWRDPAR
jgi:hypothetical protein